MTPAALQRLQPPSESVKIDLRLVDRSSSSSGLLDQVASRTGGFGGVDGREGTGEGRAHPPQGEEAPPTGYKQKGCIVM